MKRVLQHNKTGLYLSSDGCLTGNLAAAHVCPNLAAAMLVCAKWRINPTDFVYRIIEPEYALLTPDFYQQSRAA